MSSTKVNILSNFTGRIITTILGIVLVPLYLKYLSVELYGIAGVFTSLQAILTLLDFGISPTLNRETARLAAMPDKTNELRSLSRTLEIVSWTSGIGVGVLAASLSPFLANYWLQAKEVSNETVLVSLLLMSLTFVFQWASSFYSGGLNGLEKQIVNNSIAVFIGIFRSVGAFLVLALISPTIQAFLLWQIIAAVLNALLCGIFFWKSLPKGESSPKFSFALFRGVWRYAAGMTGINVVSLLLTQTDKIVLSKLITLEQFGYYTLAVTIVAAVINTIGGSFYNVFYPKFVALIAVNDDSGLRNQYHFSNQLMAVFLIPAMLMLAFFSFQILMIWTKNPEIAENARSIMTLCALGTGLHALKWIPYSVQIASGITKIAFYLNVGAIIFLVPFMIYATINYGAAGGLMSLIILSVMYILVGMQIMHRSILKGELLKWYFEDISLPAIGALLVVGTGYYFYPASFGRWQAFVYLSVISVLAVVAGSLFAPRIRSTIFTKLNFYR